MRLKRGVHEYIMPKGMVDYYESFVKVGSNYFNLCHVNILDMKSMPSRGGKIWGVPSYIARFKRNGRDWIKLYPVPEKAWKLIIRYTEVKEI